MIKLQIFGSILYFQSREKNTPEKKVVPQYQKRECA
jgi:hypothetical protein